MYEYQFASVEKKGFFFLTPEVNHRDIINRAAKVGWRYVGYLPTEMNGEGTITKLDLIFERPLKIGPEEAKP